MPLQAASQRRPEARGGQQQRAGVDSWPTIARGIILVSSINSEGGRSAARSLDIFKAAFKHCFSPPPSRLTHL